MPKRTLSKTLFLEADRARHQELIDYALELIRDHEDHAPRIDTGEWVVTAQEKLDDLQASLNIDNPHPLRRVEIDFHDNRRGYAARLEPFAGPFPWENANDP